MPRSSNWSALRRLGAVYVCAIVYRGAGLCAWCGVELAVGTWQIDHVVPRCLGGPDSAENLVPSCSSCNVYETHRDDAFARMRVMVQLSTPLDLASGRMLAERVYPWFLARERHDVERKRRTALVRREVIRKEIRDCPF